LSRSTEIASLSQKGGGCDGVDASPTASVESRRSPRWAFVAIRHGSKGLCVFPNVSEAYYSNPSASLIRSRMGSGC